MGGHDRPISPGMSIYAKNTLGLGRNHVDELIMTLYMCIKWLAFRAVRVILSRLRTLEQLSILTDGRTACHVPDKRSHESLSTVWRKATVGVGHQHEASIRKAGSSTPIQRMAVARR